MLARVKVSLTPLIVPEGTSSVTIEEEVITPVVAIVIEPAPLVIEIPVPAVRVVLTNASPELEPIRRSPSAIEVGFIAKSVPP